MSLAVQCGLLEWVTRGHMTKPAQMLPFRCILAGRDPACSGTASQKPAEPAAPPPPPHWWRLSIMESAMWLSAMRLALTRLAAQCPWDASYFVSHQQAHCEGGQAHQSETPTEGLNSVMLCRLLGLLLRGHHQLWGRLLCCSSRFSYFWNLCQCSTFLFIWM